MSRVKTTLEKKKFTETVMPHHSIAFLAIEKVEVINKQNGQRDQRKNFVSAGENKGCCFSGILTKV